MTTRQRTQPADEPRTSGAALAQVPLYPVNLDISGKRCLVVGGGSVAARKINALVLCGGRVEVISPEVCADIARLADTGSINWVARSYRSSDIDDAFLVFAATDDPETQRTVARDAAVSLVLLNSADDPARSDFHVPAKIRRGDFVIAVSTGGGSPALASVIKQRLAAEFGEEYGVLVELMARIRRRVVNQESDPEENRDLFQTILELPVLALIRRGDWPGVERLLRPVLPAAIDCGEMLDQLRRDLDGARPVPR